jgi:uncharacterized damage-inducible protein DinB
MSGNIVDIAPIDGLNAQVGLQLAMLEETTCEWRDELGRVSQEAVLWQPIPNGHSIGALLLHIADVEAYWLHEIAAGHVRSEEELKTLLSEETQQYKMQWPAPPKKPLAWYFAQHGAIRERTREIVRKLDAPEHCGKGSRNRAFTLRWLLHHVNTHEAYHGGQAVLLSLLYKSRKGG